MLSLFFPQFPSLLSLSLSSAPSPLLCCLESQYHSVQRRHQPDIQSDSERKMRHHLILHLSCVSLVMLWGHGCARHVPMVYSISMDGSGDGGEPDLIFPVDSPHHPVSPTADVAPTVDVGPVDVSPTTTLAPTLVSTITNTITTTMIRLKDFMVTRVVDFLQDNMLIIIVVTSLLIVMIFIICCAATMSQKRKLEAYKLPANSPSKYMDHTAEGVKSSSEVQTRVCGGPDSARRVQIQGTPKNLRTPSAALVGEKVGKEPKPKEVQKVKDVEEKETRRVEPKHKGQKAEEVQQCSSPSTSQPMVCTCHLRKANH
ncbi:transmembrane protein 119-like [Salvelinus fontinalis]|uniref:transmembrane protein 119-like n=1 Tax=Salvelinus fontinalis TaxID=8038 RepID=UPI002486B226|nr:transmembrane protein 119-like [Salvelinus fontinalis]